MAQPTVTVVMPVYNCERWLGEALDSILFQSHRDLELLAIDDGSRDGSAELLAACRDPRLRVHRHERNLGIIATLNEGLELAEGRYVARMDGDDLAFPHRLARQVAYLDAHPEVAVLGGEVVNIGMNRHTWRVPRDPAGVRARLFFSNPLAHAAVMLRPDFLRREGLRYDPTYLHAEDYALWVAVAERCQVANLPEKLLRLRMHPSSTSQKNAEEQRRTVRRIRAEQLAKVGIAASEADLDLHDALAEGVSDGTPEFLDRTDGWLRGLVAAGRALGPDVEGALALEAAFRWGRICRRSRRLGLAALRRFRASPLHRKTPAVTKAEVVLGAVAGALRLGARGETVLFFRKKSQRSRKRREKMCREYLARAEFAAASPPHAALRPLADGTRLDLVTVAFNNEMVIEQQIRLLTKYLQDPFCYSVADNSPDLDKRRKIRSLCEEKGVPYLLLPPNPFIGNDPSTSHGLALNFIYENYVKPRNAELFGFLDHDIFPVEPTRITPFLEKTPVFGLVQTRDTRWYLWPGFCFFRSEHLRDRAVDFLPGDGCDTGGKNWDSLYSRLERADVPVLRHETGKLRDGDNRQSDLYERVGSWVHTINASSWKAIAPKDDLVKRYLEQF